MKSLKFPAKYIRGGTSKGIFLDSRLLPLNEIERDKILLKIMGSPDPTGLQLDGMGGGITSTSKVVLLSKKFIDNKIYLNYNFGQVLIKENKIDWSGNCGNLASGILEYIRHDDKFSDCYEILNNQQYTCKVRVWQQNRNHKMYIWGDLSGNRIKISGVKDENYPIFVEFDNILNDDNTNLFPTGNLIDDIKINQEIIKATLMIGTNPIVIIKAANLGLEGFELPNQYEYDKIKIKLDMISKKAAELMKIENTNSLRIAWVSEPVQYLDTSGTLVEKNNIDIIGRITATGRIHHAFTGTGAINIGIAAGIKGTTVNNVLNKTNSKYDKLILGHPGGSITIESDIEFCKFRNKWKINKAGFLRTSRLLMDGYVYL